MNTELVKQDATKELTTPMEGAWGAENANSSNILIPKLMLMQGLSKEVTNGNARMGDIIDSVSGEVLGSALEKDLKPIDIVPISSFDTWQIFKKEGGKLHYTATIPYGPDNSHWQQEWETDEERRDLLLNFYVLIKEQAEKDPSSFPYLLTFKRTSTKSGRKLVTYFAKCRMHNSPPAANVFELCGKRVENDHGVFYTWEVSQKEKTSPEVIEAAFKWWNTLSAKREDIKVDDKEEYAQDNESAPVNEEERQF